MKVLITGAAGFIGSQLAYRFWKRWEEFLQCQGIFVKL